MSVFLSAKTGRSHLKLANRESSTAFLPEHYILLVISSLFQFKMPKKRIFIFPPFLLLEVMFFTSNFIKRIPPPPYSYYFQIIPLLIIVITFEKQLWKHIENSCVYNRGGTFFKKLWKSYRVSEVDGLQLFPYFKYFLPRKFYKKIIKKKNNWSHWHEILNESLLNPLRSQRKIRKVFEP